MSEGANEPGEITVGVGDRGRGGYPKRVTFRGTELRQVPVIMEDREEFGRYRDTPRHELPGVRVQPDWRKTA